MRTFGGNTACIQISSQGHELIIDSGTGIRRLGQELLEQHTNGHVKKLTLLVSHAHWDHIQGFPHFSPANRENFELDVYSLFRPDGDMKSLLNGQQEQPFTSLPFERLRAPLKFHDLGDGDRLEIGPFVIHNYRLNHPGITCGFRIEADDGVIAYVSDVAPSRDLLLAEGLPDGRESHWLRELYENQLKLANQADFVIYDTFFTPEWYAQRKHWGHSTAEDGIEVTRYAGAKNLFMFHHNPERTDEELAGLLQKHQRNLEGADFRLLVAREGDSYDVDGSGVTLCE